MKQYTWMTGKRVSKFGTLLKRAFNNWLSRDPFREGAVIGYYTIFALPGLLVVIITLTSIVFGAELVNGHLHKEISSVMGTDTADQIQALLSASLMHKDSYVATIIGLVTMLIGATAVFAELQTSFNAIWHVESVSKRSGVVKFLLTRIFSFGLILSIAFLLLISLVFSSLLAALGMWIQEYWGASFLTLFWIVNSVFSVAVITLLFALMLKILPDARIKWHSVWVGACIMSVLFVLGKSAIGLYFGSVHPGLGYGAAGSIVLILLWTSYSTMIVFFGAEFTKVYADDREESQQAKVVGL